MLATIGDEYIYNIMAFNGLTRIRENLKLEGDLAYRWTASEDKADVVESTLFGQGVETISPIPPSHPFYAHDIALPKIDPAAARKLLAAAGYSNSVKVPIIAPVGRPVRERLAVTLQQLAKPGGFDLQVQRVRYSSFGAEVSGKAPLYIDGFFGRPTTTWCARRLACVAAASAPCSRTPPPPSTRRSPSARS